MLLLAVELRQLRPRAGGRAARRRWPALAADLERVTSTIARGRGQVEAVAGHRVLARFDGESRGHRALTVAARILDGATPFRDVEPPAVALASGKAVVGPVTWGERAERALVGLPVQQLESLLREATSGEVLMSREVYEELEGAPSRPPATCWLPAAA